MCWADHRQTYRTPLTRTLNSPSYIRPEVVSLLDAALPNAILAENMLTVAIVALSKELSMVFADLPRFPDLVHTR
jgi:hypothetical protein